MTDYGRDGSGDLDAVTITTGTVVPFVQSAGGVTLGVNTYYYILGGSGSPTGSQTSLMSAHVKWASAVAATITVETCNFPSKINGVRQGADDILDYSSTAGDWIIENPSTAIVAVTGSGNSSTAATVTCGGTAAGGCTFHLGNLGTKRIRLKVVATVGGVMRCNAHGKMGE